MSKNSEVNTNPGYIFKSMTLSTCYLVSPHTGPFLPLLFLSLRTCIDEGNGPLLEDAVKNG